MKKQVFENMVEKAFWGLEAKYGFKKTEATYVDRTCTIQFKNATTAVLLNYELGNKPWLVISDVHDAKNKSTLGWLLVELGKDQAPQPEQAFHPTPLKKDDLNPTLEKMGQEIVEYGGDLLKGNFSLMPKLQDRAKKYEQECERYMALHQA
jgi:hypothetical protein